MLLLVVNLLDQVFDQNTFGWNMNFKQRTIAELADMICGNFKPEENFFPYRSSSLITRFFRDADTDYAHDGSTRNWWVAETLKTILNEPQAMPNYPPDTFMRVIQLLMDQGDFCNEDNKRENALSKLNLTLSREGFEAFYAEDKKCYLKHVATNTIVQQALNPHRPLSTQEQKRRDQLTKYLENISEDDLISEVLTPLFRQLGFHRITATDHRDKALEYGNDIWMKYTIPTQHVLYFGMQVKKGKIDSAGVTKGSNANVAEILNQVLMMLGHEIFDPEIGKGVLVDHAFIVAGGEITKAAKAWLGKKLDASKRSQIMFMDKEDILNLYIVTNLPLPDAAIEQVENTTLQIDDDLPF